MRTVLIRHPAPDIAAGICYGRLDVGLTPAARRELVQCAANPILQGSARVWTSPARRCHELAVAIAHHLAADLAVDDRLLELDFGEWEGRAWNEVPRASLDEWAALAMDFAPPGGESGAAMIRRVSRFFADLNSDAMDCIVVSHGGPLKILIALLNRQPIDLFAPAPPIGSINVTHGWR